MRIGIGIDTGGTYTDAVAYDFEDKKVLGTAKALTTREDLSIGIIGALSALSEDHIKAAQVISLSTTLATNACVEDKGGSAKLVFFGGQEKILSAYGAEYGLPAVSEIYIQREPDLEAFLHDAERPFFQVDGVGIVDVNAGKNSAETERRAKALFTGKRDIPVVCGHELFSELNSLQRGASTLLNARLFPVIKDFLKAIKAATDKLSMKANLVIMRSDGSLMSEAYAHARPIETLLCGPAASVMGSAQLAREADTVVVDMGGTTTDIALLKGGVPVKAVGGVSVGKWKTFVSGLYIKTFGLGGDTAIHYNDDGAFLENYRVIPLCAAAAQYPEIVKNLRALVAEEKVHTKYLHEHYLLIRDISGSSRYTDDEKMFCAALKNGPLIFQEAACCVPGKDMYTFDVSRLLREGVVQICGLTPTDIMHLRGDFKKFPVDAAKLGAEYVAACANMSVDELCETVYDQIRLRLYVNIVKALLENKDENYLKNGVSRDVERFIHESYKMAKSGIGTHYLSMMFTTEFTLTGVGAPIHIFLKDVADLLGTKAVIPEHSGVANALGAVVGNVHATCSIEIAPIYDAGGLGGYTVYGNTETKVFDDLSEAEAFAIREAEMGAVAEAKRRGAQGELSVTSELIANEAKARYSTVHIGTHAVAQAAGKLTPW